MKKKLISIIIPTFNRANVIENTLYSIQNQSYTNWECLIVDDGSTDDTYLVLKKQISQDSRFQFHKRPSNRKKGANACRNYGLEKSSGEFIIWFDSDDIMHLKYLETQFNTLNNSNFNYGICKSNWQTIENDTINGFRSNVLKSNDAVNDYIRFIIFWPINAVCYKRDFILENALNFDETLQQSQEYDFHVKVLQIDKNYAIIDRSLITVVASADSISYSQKNAHAKTVSSIKVRRRFLANSNNNITYKTQLFLLNDMFRMFQQQTMLRHTKTSLYAAYAYLLAHFKNKDIAKKYFFKHLVPVIVIAITYNLFGIGYKLFKKSNTFSYDKNRPSDA